MSTLPFEIESLLDPGAYPHRPSKVELVQTQMSLLLLTGDYAYKVKKPVDLGYLDYTTLEKRHHFCHKELELNRRLCADAYLAVVPITEEDRRFCVEGQGKAVEYAVKMRQLPRERMLDALLQRGAVTDGMIEAIAQKLVCFHNCARTDPGIASFGGLDVVGQNCDENFNQSEKYIGTSLMSGQYRTIRHYTYSFIDSNTSLFHKRAQEGRIRDCHGDLHAAHVCFTDGICIYDCIEFNDRFRYADVASEIAFLAMDLDRYRQTSLSRHLVDSYVGLSSDEELMELLNFYKCYRAYVRGKVESFKLDDTHIPDEEKAKILSAARRYFELAESYT
ncbi:MAG: hypothetical protein ACNA7X_04520 [Dehalococcoidia bacterium]